MSGYAVKSLLPSSCLRSDSRVTFRLNPAKASPSPLPLPNILFQILYYLPDSYPTIIPIKKLMKQAKIIDIMIPILNTSLKY